MKTFEVLKHEKILKKKTLDQILKLIVFTLIIIILGLICFTCIIYLFLDRTTPWDLFYTFFKQKNETVNEVFTRYSILYLSLLSFISACLYGSILRGAQKNEKFKLFYINLREQIYEMLTMSIFLFGFIPLFLKYITTSEFLNIVNEIDSLTAGFFMGVVPPYIYSVCSKIYHSTYEKQFSKAIDDHVVSKFKH